MLQLQPEAWREVVLAKGAPVSLPAPGLGEGDAMGLTGTFLTNSTWGACRKAG